MAQSYRVRKHAQGDCRLQLNNRYLRQRIPTRFAQDWFSRRFATAPTKGGGVVIHHAVLAISRMNPKRAGRSAEEENEDVRLMGLIGGGDMAAFEQLVEPHQALVARTAARMLGSNSDVEDIAQQVFIRVWKSASRYRPRAKFTTWLLKITRNLVFNELRRTKRRAQLPLQAEPDAEENPLPDEVTAAPDASLLESEMQQAIEKTSAELPET